VNLTTDQPLTDDEFTRPPDFLDAVGLSAMNIEMLDGYFSIDLWTRDGPAERVSAPNMGRRLRLRER
jgi:hypothetical protein